MNSTNDEGAGFDVSTNRVTIIHSNGSAVPYPLKPKALVADDIVSELVKLVK